MKKTFLFLIAMGLLCASCEKTPVNEWNRFYGFTKDDIVGHYDANPDESLYEELPTEGVTVYNTVTIDITSLQDNMVSLRIVIPHVINKAFSGVINGDDSTSDLILNGFGEDIMATVYKNSKGQIRMHGRVKGDRHHRDGDPVINVYGFDVLKADAK